jgi:Na+-driven multidrug efflux pump
VGLPTALIGIMFSLVYIAFSRSAARFGAPSLAIVGVANRIEAIQFVVSGAIGTAAAALVGQNLGARRPDRASLVMRTGVSWIAVVSIALTAIIATHPTLFLGLFTQDAEALRIGVPYLRILAICLLATGIEMVVAEAVQGSGHTRPMSIIYNSFSLLRIPLAFWVPDWTGTGVLGIAWVIATTCIVRTGLMLAWVSRGTWKTGLAREIAPESSSVPDACA